MNLEDLAGGIKMEGSQGRKNELPRPEKGHQQNWIVSSGVQGSELGGPLWAVVKLELWNLPGEGKTPQCIGGLFFCSPSRCGHTPLNSGAITG